jgi:DNA-directed RNA polymerase subunit K/omega
MKQIEDISDSLNSPEVDSPENVKPISVFQQLIVAFQRHKQLSNGATPRISLPFLKTKMTRVAVEEVGLGLIIYHSIE